MVLLVYHGCAVVNRIKTRINLVYSEIYSSVSAVNTRPLGLKTNQLMLYREIIAVCSQIQTKHTNTLCGQNVECRTYHAVNTLRLGYKNQSVNGVQ